MNAYRYLYFRIYDWNLRTWGANDMPQYNALIGVTILVFLALFDLALLIEVNLRISLLDSAGIGKLHVVAILLFLGAINYLIFIRNENFSRLKEVFSAETDKQRLWRLGYCLAFVAVDFTGFFVLVAMKR